MTFWAASAEPLHPGGPAALENATAVPATIIRKVRSVRAPSIAAARAGATQSPLDETDKAPGKLERITGAVSVENARIVKQHPGGVLLELAIILPERRQRSDQGMVRIHF